MTKTKNIERIDTERTLQKDEYWFLLSNWYISNERDADHNTKSTHFYKVGRYKTDRGVNDAQQRYELDEGRQLFIIAAKDAHRAKRAASNYVFDQATNNKFELYSDFWGTVTHVITGFDDGSEEARLQEAQDAMQCAAEAHQ